MSSSPIMLSLHFSCGLSSLRRFLFTFVPLQPLVVQCDYCLEIGMLLLLIAGGEYFEAVECVRCAGHG